MINNKIVKILEVGQDGGESLYFEDVDNDGEKELIFRQSAGMLCKSAYKNSGHGYITDENEYLLQHTCIKQDGTLLWRKGEPWPFEKPFNTHSGSQMTVIKDINGDGEKEILMLFKDELTVIKAADGSFVKSIKLATDSFNIIALQDISKGQSNIILKCDGESEYGYGSPIMAYDSELNFLWEQTELKGGGHNIVFKDIDGDGKEEIFEGYNLLDHDGSILWSFDFPSHSDQTTIEDINGDGIEEVIYCTDNEDLIVVNVKGELLYIKEDFPHPQKASIGKFMANVPGLQIFMNNRATHGGSVMLDCEGNVLWEFPCNGYSQIFKCKKEGGLDLILFKPSPGRLPEKLQAELVKRSEELGYKKLPIVGNKGFEPFILNGKGEILYTFPFLEESIDVTHWGIPEKWKSDHGAGFSMLLEDIDNDGEMEYIFYNRKKVWILKDGL